MSLYRILDRFYQSARGGYKLNYSDYEKFLNILREMLYENLKDMEITLDSDLKEDLFLDSISFYTLIVSLEQAFNFTFTKVNIDADEFKTVRSMIAYMDLLGTSNQYNELEV